MADQVAAVGVSVEDLEKSARFYTEALGFKRLQTINLDHMDEIIVGPERGTPVVLMKYKDGVKRDHGAFAGKLVFYCDDVGAAVAKIRDIGGEITEEPKPYPGFGTIGFAKDPNGYTLELIQRPKG